MNNLSTSYVDAVISGGGTVRKYTMTTNGDNTVSFTDSTTYSTTGSSFGANDINATNSTVNAIMRTRTVSVPTTGWSRNVNVYKVDITVSGITATDTPIVALYMHQDAVNTASAKTMQKMFSYIVNVTTGTNKITVYSHTIPTTSYQILLKGV